MEIVGLNAVKKFFKGLFILAAFLLILAFVGLVSVVVIGRIFFNKVKELSDQNKSKSTLQPPLNVPRPPQTTTEKNAEQEQKALAEATGIPFIPPTQETQQHSSIQQPPIPQEAQQPVIPPQETQPIIIPPQETQPTFIPPQETQPISTPPQESQPTFTDIISNVFRAEQNSLIEQEQENQRLLLERQRREQELLIQASREAEERQRQEQELLIQASLDTEERRRREQQLLIQASLEAEEKQKREQELLAQQEKERQELLAQQEQTRLRLLAEQQKLVQELLADQRRREAEIVAEQERILAEQIRQERELLESIKADAREIASSQLSGVNVDNVLVPLIDNIVQKTADSSNGLNTIGRQEVLVSNTENAVANLNELINSAEIRLAELVAGVARQEDLLVVADVRRNMLELSLARPVLVTNLNNARTLLTELIANKRVISDRIISLEGRVVSLDKQIDKYIAEINYYTRIINENQGVGLRKRKRRDDNNKARHKSHSNRNEAQPTRAELLIEIGELQNQLNS